ncbi:MAG: hypothetical protein [Caudoviricetes sp.]|nr:MAG: hypothetical protein [Caudoviricetes sp.]
MIFELININHYTECDCCGGIFDYELLCKFCNIEKNFYYDDHFGGEPLHPEWCSPTNLEIILNYYKKSLYKYGIKLLHIEHNLSHIVDIYNNRLYYSTFHLIINNHYHSYNFITQSMYSMNSKKSFIGFFEFIGINLKYKERMYK